ncbi:MAG: branched-chain amino acid ABC transporter permease [Armatimonadota bacterium]|nr:branched-chain amino acid ABC transporter permease [Armatimonadota bacterium]MDR7450819.1 branched-chain amino acid ABC transporter permease [Armatimonadota bacterium]MDR7465740.1 branched-chain amino acid ABC transporter permease [Armatimonadota bacterium]MDR7493648.1 branched-chain amino acid ABC transporter permease [Armatimonadota bacterium]MDR7499103.1 branched-chain amino acid ABC transporter permease [Armatimonadota bacterium]
MALLAQYLVGGLAVGSLYALVALGIVLLYRTSRILNFAHGDLATFGTFVAYAMLTALRWPFGAAAGGSLVVTAVVGAAFFFLILRPAREATLLGKIVITLGLALFLQGGVAVLWGTDTKTMPFPLSDVKVYRLGEVVVSQLSLGSVAVGLILLAGMYVLVQRTRVGLAMRAVSQNTVAAQVLGIPVRRIFTLTWGLASALGAAAGILLAPVTLLDPYMMLDPFLKGFAAAVLGGIDSMPGAALGGLLLGVVETLFGAYVSVKFKTTLAFLIIIAVLIVRPEGLLGREYKRRV